MERRHKELRHVAVCACIELCKEQYTSAAAECGISSERGIIYFALFKQLNSWDLPEYGAWNCGYCSVHERYSIYSWLRNIMRMVYRHAQRQATW